MIEERRPDIVVIEKKEKVCLQNIIIFDIVVPGDHSIDEQIKINWK